VKRRCEYSSTRYRKREGRVRRKEGGKLKKNENKKLKLLRSKERIKSNGYKERKNYK
jgi:hypothetical protein